MARHNCYEEPINPDCMERMQNFSEDNGVRLVDFDLLRIYIKQRLSDNHLPVSRLAESIGISRINIFGFFAGKDKVLSVKAINNILYILDGTIEGYEQFKRENK